jgi:ribosomal protein S18 acetylase RimI-like enzyme
VSRSRRRAPLRVNLRRGRMSDLDALLGLEEATFTVDRLSRRSVRHFLAAPTATFIVATAGGRLVGYALVLYRPRSEVARLYSIAVASHSGRRGVGTRLLRAAEDAARRRRCRVMRLEVHEHNTRAIAGYEKSGYRPFARHPDYYDDHATALRFEKTFAAQGRSRPTALAKKSDSGNRIGFDGAHRSRHSRHSVRFRL